MDVIQPEKAGFHSGRLQHIDSAMQRFIDDGKVGGIATVVARKGRIVQQCGYGLASTKPEKAMQPDTIFRIWSMTKAITAVAGLILYEKGQFVLDQDITEFMPEFKDTPVYVSGEGDSMVVEPRKGAMTIRQALTHTVGLAAGLTPSHPLGAMMAKTIDGVFQSGGNLESAIREIAKVPLIYHPFTRWHYGHGLEVMARIVEIISGKPYHIFLQEEIFGPLGMHDSGYVVPEAKLDRFSALYKWDENSTLVQQESPTESHHYLTRDIDLSTFWTAGGFGLVSTPLDYLRFAQMLLNGGELEGTRILAPRTVALMTANHLPDELIPYNFPDAPPKYGYGHGLGVHVLLDHGKAGSPCANGEYWKDGGAGTLFWVDPTYDLVGIVMYQLLDFWRVPIFDTFRATVYQAMLS